MPPRDVLVIGAGINGLMSARALARAGSAVTVLERGAAGREASWSNRLLAPLGAGLPLEPVRGQMLLLRAPAGRLRRIVLAGGHYLIPRRDGHVLAGSTLERAGFDKSTTGAAREALHAAAVRLVPALAGCPVATHWAGLRPGSPGGIPWVGPHPRLAGLHLNVGQHRNGIVLGPACARLLADQLLGCTPVVAPAPYAPPEAPAASPGNGGNSGG